MKSTYRIGAAGVALAAALSLASAAQAAPATATAEARAEIVRALTLENETPLDFGKVAMSGAGAGTVTVAADGTLSSCGPNLTCYAATSAAKFNVTTGSIGKTLTVTLPANVTLTHSSGLVGANYELELSSYTTDATNTAGVYTIVLADDGSGSNGVGSFSVGGTLTFDGTEAEGLYLADITVTADYS